MIKSIDIDINIIKNIILNEQYKIARIIEAILFFRSFLVINSHNYILFVQYNRKFLMKLGIYGGGFKPFTMGHFSMLALAESENDKVILLYGMAGRSKGSDFVYSPEMAREIFEINKIAIERKFKKVNVIEAIPSPIHHAIGAILSIRDNKVEPDSLFARLGINPNDIEQLTIYVGPDDIKTYSKYFNTPRVRFDQGPGEAQGVARMERIVAAVADNIEDLQGRIAIRGSLLRALVGKANLEELMKYFPPIYTESEALKIFEIMQRGLTKHVNESLKLLIKHIVLEA